MSLDFNVSLDGGAARKFIEVVSAGFGRLYTPTAIRKEAAAQAAANRLLTETEGGNRRILARADADANEIMARVDAELAERAVKRLESQVLEEQVHIESIVDNAIVKYLPEDVSDEPVDQTWRHRFFEIARGIGEEEMQDLWSRVLASEVAQPGSYSLRALETLRNMSKGEAKLFSVACSCAVGSNDAWHFLARKSRQNQPQDAIQGSGLGFKDVLALADAGVLVDTGLIFSVTTELFAGTHGTVLGFADIHIFVHHETQERLEFYGFPFTTTGSELTKLSSPTANIPYLRKMATDYEKHGGYRFMRALPKSADQERTRDYELADL